MVVFKKKTDPYDCGFDLPLRIGLGCDTIVIETKSVFMIMLVEPWLESLMIKIHGGCSIYAFYSSWNFYIFGSLLFEW